MSNYDYRDPEYFRNWYPEAKDEAEAYSLWHADAEDLDPEEVDEMLPPWIVCRSNTAYDQSTLVHAQDDYDPEQSMEVISEANRTLAHYGTPRHSGRYPWGSGDNPYQRNADFVGQVHKMKDRGMTPTQIAYAMGMNTSTFRKKLANAKDEMRAYEVAEMYRLYDKGLSRSAVARRMGINESTLRGYENKGVERRMTATAKNADLLQKAVDKNGYIDVGVGMEHHLGITKHSLGNALNMLKEKGYSLQDVRYEQMGTGKVTTFKVLCKPGTTWAEVMKNRDKIKLPVDLYSEDGEVIRQIEAPVSISSKRIAIRYPNDDGLIGNDGQRYKDNDPNPLGGLAKDGVIELRRGVADIDLNKARYAQVRIAVDGTHYLKGMAVYGDNMPDGVDIIFNTNKKVTTPMINKDDPDHSVLKPMKRDKNGNIDMSNPFGANIKDDDDDLIRAQRHYKDADGVEHQSALNIVSEEGTWNTWSKNLASQFLSKQPTNLAKQQLDLAYKIAEDEFKEIASYDNPTVRAKMLEDFAGLTDSKSVHLKAAALPRQATCVILPLTNTSDTEIYAPQFRDGEQVALVRYPHTGPFETPILTVNNNNKEAKRVFGSNPIDAVGINAKVAERLSGADFDGDTVLVLPTENVNIRGTANNRPSAYKSLDDFDAKKLYPKYPGMHIMTDQEKGQEMGSVSNLITDMTLKGASPSEICRAVKHSMVVIDAQKHELNWKQSEQDFGIPQLKAKYQGGERRGASTFISRSTSDMYVDERKQKAPSKMTPDEYKRYLEGEIIWTPTNRQRKDDKPNRKLLTKDEKKILDEGSNEQKRQLIRQLYSDGRMKLGTTNVQEKVQKGAEYDPYELLSRNEQGQTTRMELIYANYARKMKDLAKQARAMARQEVDIPYDPEMRKLYKKEYEQLKAAIAKAESNSPLERQAQLIANTKFAAIKYNNPDMDKEHLKREKGRQLDIARKTVGAKKYLIGASEENPLTERMWEAISKGAITPTMMRQVLKNADMGRVRELAMPRTSTGISPAKLSLAKQMLKNGYSQADVADQLDISRSKLVKAIGTENF